MLLFILIASNQSIVNFHLIHKAQSYNFFSWVNMLLIKNKFFVFVTVHVVPFNFHFQMSREKVNLIQFNNKTGTSILFD